MAIGGRALAPLTLAPKLVALLVLLLGEVSGCSAVKVASASESRPASCGQGCSNDILRNLEESLSGRVPESSLSVLEDLFVQLHGNEWRWRGNVRWDFSTPFVAPCDPLAPWEGVWCTCSLNYTSCDVTGLDLSGYELRGGPLPESLGNLSGLRTLTLSNNSIHGQLPLSIGRLAALETLQVTSNKLSGALPRSWAGLRSLRVLDLDDNQLSDTFPLFLTNLTSLEVISLSFNRISGSLPEELGALRNLSELSLYFCDLRGRLPVALANLTTLHVLSLGFNRLSGPLAPTLSALRGLRTLNIMDNLLTGTFPHALLELTELTTIELEDNFLSGTLPAALDNDHRRLSAGGAGNPWQQLSTFAIRGNSLGGEFPHFLCNCSALTFIALGENAFTGAVPSCVFDLDGLQFLSLERAQFVGSLPPNISSDLHSLRGLFMNDNHFTGPIPAGTYLLTLLEQLELGGNALTGTLSALVGGLAHLTQLSVDGNLLTGTLPVELAALTQLYRLDVSENDLRGPLSGCFDWRTQSLLEVVIVGGNRFTSTLPVDVFALPRLQVFSAYSNCLESSVPAQICGAGGLDTLVLDGMHTAKACRAPLLTGLSTYMLSELYSITLPPCIFSMPRLVTLHASALGLVGSLPASANLSHSLVDLSLSHNRLRGSVPQSFQLHGWAALDLSFNALTGNLDFDLARLLDAPQLRRLANASWSLQVNKLSGDLPPALRYMHDVSILEGNLFQCDLSGSNLPAHDPAVSTYACGSNAFNVAYFLWLGLLGVPALLGLAAMALVACQQQAQCEEGPLQSLAQVPGEWLCGSIAAMKVWAQHFDRETRCFWVLPETDDEDEVEGGDSRARVAPESQAPAALLAALRGTAHDFDTLRTLVIRGMVLMCVVLAPCYALASLDHGTFVHQYAWVASLAFLQGDVALTIELTTLLVVLISMLASLLDDGELREALHSWRSVVVTPVSLVPDKPSSLVHYASLSLEAGTDGTVERPCDAEGKSPSLTPSTDPCSSCGDGATSPSSALPTRVFLRTQAAVFLVNLVLAGGINVLFAYVTVSGTPAQVQGMQVVLAIFGLVWNSAAIQWLAVRLEARWTGTETLKTLSSRHLQPRDLLDAHARQLHDQQRMLPLQLCVALVNAVAVPCVVTAGLSANCFYYALVAAAPVVSRSQYTVCEALEPADNLRCLVWQTREEMSHFDPPFAYSFQCSSDLLAYYAPSLVYSCIAGGVLWPVLQLLVAHVVAAGARPDASRRLAVVTRFVGEWLLIDIMQPVDVGQGQSGGGVTLYSGQTFISAQDVLVTQVTYLSLFLTFGVVFPPLGVALGATMLLLLAFQRYALGSFLRRVEAAALAHSGAAPALALVGRPGKGNHAAPSSLSNAKEEADKGCTVYDALELELRDFPSIVQSPKWMLVVTMCWFYALFAADTAGYVHSTRGSYWVIAVLGALPLVLFAFERGARWTLRRHLHLAPPTGVAMPSVLAHT